MKDMREGELRMGDKGRKEEKKEKGNLAISQVKIVHTISDQNVVQNI